MSSKISVVQNSYKMHGLIGNNSVRASELTLNVVLILGGVVQNVGILNACFS